MSPSNHGAIHRWPWAGLPRFPPTKGVDYGKHSKGDDVRFVLEFLLLIIVALIVPSGVPWLMARIWPETVDPDPNSRPEER